MANEKAQKMPAGTFKAGDKVRLTDPDVLPKLDSREGQVTGICSDGRCVRVAFPGEVDLKGKQKSLAVWYGVLETVSSPAASVAPAKL
jgi:hypothetical protein